MKKTAINFINKRKDSVDVRVELLHVGDQLNELTNSIAQLSRLYSTSGDTLTSRNLKEFYKLMKKYRKERDKLSRKSKRLINQMELAQRCS